MAFACPTEAVFADASRHNTSSGTARHVWDPRTSDLTATIHGFGPTRQHRGARQLAAVEDATLVRWAMPSDGRLSVRQPPHHT